MSKNPNRKSRIKGMHFSVVVCLSAILTIGIGSPTIWAAGDDLYTLRITEMAHDIHAMFEAEKWDSLDKTAGDLRSSKARFPDGTWKLAGFYDGLDPARFARTENDWTQWFQHLDHWKTAHPDSITQCVARGRAYTSYAWHARGTGWASSVSQNGFSLFNVRLTQAREALEEGAKLKDQCPEWYAIKLRVDLGQGTREEAEDDFKKGVAFAPGYYDIYNQYGYFLLPRWHGQEGEWEQFAEEAAKKYDPSEGLTVYNRVVMNQFGLYGNLFKESGITWPKLKQGFLDMEKAYPDSSWNLNYLLKFAVMAGDRETASAAVARIGDKPMVHAWRGHDFEHAKAWALGNGDKKDGSAPQGSASPAGSASPLKP